MEDKHEEVEIDYIEFRKEVEVEMEEEENKKSEKKSIKKPDNEKIRELTGKE